MSSFERQLNDAAENGHLDVVQVLLQDGRTDPAANNSSALRFAAENGKLDEVQVLLQDGRADPAADDSYALRFAAKNGHLDVVQALLQDGRADPADEDSYALYWPAVEDSYALYWAAKNGHSNVVQALLQDGRADPAARYSSALRFAARNGHLDVVQAFLQDGRADPTAGDSDALRRSAENGNLDAVQVLLRDKRADPAAEDNYALRIAAKNGHLDIVQVLLQDGRTDPAADNSSALRFAAENGHLDIVQALLRDPRVGQRAFDLNLLKEKFSANQIELLVSGEDSKSNMLQWLIHCFEGAVEEGAEFIVWVWFGAVCCKFYTKHGVTRFHKRKIVFLDPSTDYNQLLYEIAISGDVARVEALGKSPAVRRTIQNRKEFLNLDNFSSEEVKDAINKTLKEAKKLENREIRNLAIVRVSLDLASIVPLAVKVAQEGFGVLVLLGFVTIVLDLGATVHTLALEFVQRAEERNKDDSDAPVGQGTQRELVVRITVPPDDDEQRKENVEKLRTTPHRTVRSSRLLSQMGQSFRSSLAQVTSQLDPVLSRNIPDRYRRAATVDKTMDAALAFTGLANAIADLVDEPVDAQTIGQLVLSVSLLAMPFAALWNYAFRDQYKYRHGWFWDLCLRRKEAQYGCGEGLSDIACVIVWVILFFIVFVRISGTSKIPFGEFIDKMHELFGFL